MKSQSEFQRYFRGRYVTPKNASTQLGFFSLMRGVVQGVIERVEREMGGSLHGSKLRSIEEGGLSGNKRDVKFLMRFLNSQLFVNFAEGVN